MVQARIFSPLTVPWAFHIGKADGLRLRLQSSQLSRSQVPKKSQSDTSSRCPLVSFLGSRRQQKPSETNYNCIAKWLNGCAANSSWGPRTRSSGVAGPWTWKGWLEQKDLKKKKTWYRFARDMSNAQKGSYRNHYMNSYDIYMSWFVHDI